MIPRFNGFFVTGTDTEIGKTALSAALTHLIGQSGLRAVAIKPVAAGQELVGGQWVNDDVQRLHAASNIDVQDHEVGPLQMRLACAPHIAAVHEGVTLDRQRLLEAIANTAAKADISVVEGVGGFCVPLHEGEARWDSADLAVDLGLPVVLVVGMRLGCINHAVLTAEAIRARGLHLAGWVANHIDPNMGYADENFATLCRLLEAPCWGRVPYLPKADPAQIAPHLDGPAILKALPSKETQPRLKDSRTQNIVILISGSGSNMQAIAQAAQTQAWSARHGIQIAAVISNRADAAGLKIAHDLGLPTEVLPHTQFESRAAFDDALRQVIDRFSPDLVVLAGFMRVLTPEFVSHYAGRLINIHPSLLPAFPGLNTHQRAIDAGCQVAGATVHEVSVEVDQGPILAQTVVPVLPEDNAEALAQRVLAAEHQLFPAAVLKRLTQR
jgi:dethiobiotin synthetase